MSGYDTAEASLHSGEPTELYVWTRGQEILHETSSDQPVTYLGDVFQPTNLRRGPIEHGPEIKRAQLPVTVQRDHPVAVWFAPGAPDQVVHLDLFRWHRGTDEVADVHLIWKGRVVGGAWSGAQAELACTPETTMLERPALRRRYTHLCGHVLYGDGCFVERELHRHPATLESVDGLVLTSAAFAGLDAGRLTAGYLRWGVAERLVVEHTGDTVRLRYPMLGLEAGAVVDVFDGCPRDFGTCGTRFGNTPRYGGWRFHPGHNPHDGRRIV